MFIAYYTIIYFFVKKFFSNVYISVNTIFKCSYLSFDWEIGHPLSMYVTRGMEESHPKGGEGYHTSCVRTHLQYLFLCFCHMVSCFTCRNFHLRHIVQYICAIVFKIIFWNNPTVQTATLSTYLCLQMRGDWKIVRVKWMALNKFCIIFFVHLYGQVH